jgi:hypothetical protein
MTLLPLVILALAEPPASAPPTRSAFGHVTTSHVDGVDPDGNRHEGDGAYGRFDGDLDLGLGVGPNLAFTGNDMGLAVRGTAFWYSTFGLDLLYVEALSAQPDIERRLGVSAVLRPLFLVRWSQALESGPPTLDLALDSLGLGVGASFATPSGRGFASRTTFEVSFGAGVPLAGSAIGPWLEFRTGVSLPQPAQGEATAMLLLSWHLAVLTPVVTAD